MFNNNNKITKGVAVGDNSKFRKINYFIKNNKYI